MGSCVAGKKARKRHDVISTMNKVDTVARGEMHLPLPVLRLLNGIPAAGSRGKE